METHYTTIFKSLAAILGALVSAVIQEVTPMLILTGAFVVADVITACRLQRRLVAAGKLPVEKARFSSARFAKIFGTLSRICGVLMLTSMTDYLILRDLGIPAMKIVAGAICFWQAISLLENEAAENDAPWAMHARRFLIDKALRYISPK